MLRRVIWYKLTEVSGLLSASTIALMLKPASTSEASVIFYQTTRRNNREDSHLHTRRRENLKSHLKIRTKFWSENLKGKDRLRDLGIAGR
jgi:hypothetical protein